MTFGTLLVCYCTTTGCHMLLIRQLTQFTLLSYTSLLKSLMTGIIKLGLCIFHEHVNTLCKWPLLSFPALESPHSGRPGKKFFHHTRSVWEVSSHCEYLENWLHAVDVNWQPG